MGSSDRKGSRQPHYDGNTGGYSTPNTSPESKTQITTAFDLDKLLPYDPNAKTVLDPNSKRHSEVDQGARPSYKEAERYSHNEPRRPSSPKPKEGSKSPSRSEDSKNSKCVSMRGVSIDPRPAMKRYKLVL